MTQHELIIEYVRANGSILPAKTYGQVFKGQMLGSETGKRCRELRKEIKGMWCNPYKKQMLESVKEGRFERFYLLGEAPKSDFIKSWFKEFPPQVKEKEKSGMLF